jgi:hypothetical protein
VYILINVVELYRVEFRIILRAILRVLSLYLVKPRINSHCERVIEIRREVVYVRKSTRYTHILLHLELLDYNYIRIVGRLSLVKAKETEKWVTVGRPTSETKEKLKAGYIQRLFMIVVYLRMLRMCT